MSAAKSPDKENTNELSKMSAAADEAIEKAVAAAAESKKFPIAQPVAAKLSGEARAVAPDAPSSEDEAISYMQAFGHVPSGWTFNPATGLQKN